MPYGTPDYFVATNAANANLGGGNGYAANPVIFDLQDVSDFASVLMYLAPTGVVTGWDVVIDFYSDQAATLLVAEFTVHSQQGAVICEVFPVIAPFMKVTATPAAAGGGQTATIHLRGFIGFPPQSLAPGDGWLGNFNAPIAGNSIGISWVNVVRTRPAWVTFWTDATAWRFVIDAHTGIAGPWFDYLRAQNGAFANAFSMRVDFTRFVPRLIAYNDDAVSRTFRISIVST